MDEEIKPRFTGGMEKKDQGLKVKNENQGWIKKGNQGLQVVERKRTKVYMLDGEKKTRFLG